MTKEELINHLEHLADYVKYSEDAPALREVIKALKYADTDPISRNRLLMYLADFELIYSPGWGANGQGDEKLYEFVKGLSDEIQQWTTIQSEERTQERTETRACDCISRQMLLEYIHGEPVGRLLCDKYNLDGLIEQLPSAQPEQRWIPCSERLPEHNQRIIAYYPENKSIMVINYNAHGFTSMSAWMSLPEPYRGERRTDG